MASEGVVLQQLPYYCGLFTYTRCSKKRTEPSSNNMGSIIETGTAFPGNTGSIPQNVTPVAEMLRLNGYSTAAFGKWHELAAWEANHGRSFHSLANRTKGDLKNFMDSSVAKPTSGHLLFMMEQHRLNSRGS